MPRSAAHWTAVSLSVAIAYAALPTAVVAVPDGALGLDGYDACFQAVLDGRADAAALNLDVGRERAERDYPGKFVLPKRPFLPVRMSLACRRSDSAQLLDKFNEGLANVPK